MEGTVWNTGCASWYIDATGRNATIWPDWTWRFRRRSRRFDPAESQPPEQPGRARGGAGMSARVLVTGASGGIGGAACAALRARGARVVGLDLRADEEHDVIACDVRDQAAIDAAVAEAIERLGGLDVLINNAGIGIPQSAGEPSRRRTRSRCSTSTCWGRGA